MHPTKVLIEPNPATLDSPLKLELFFETDETCTPGTPFELRLSLLVDVIHNRVLRELGAFPSTQDASSGHLHFTCELPNIDVSGIPATVLDNVSCLKASVIKGSQSVAEVQMVMQVTRESLSEMEPKDMKRIIFSPLQ
eukprot:GDKH01028023.1.p1 GENE.GDKH01028023.1~~GDKH01028023.1.p1  ORF type:complete len:138 (+),score=4.47 GDKH01028023.1:190-603(+)